MSGDTVLSVEGLSKRFAPDLRRALAYGLRDIAGELLPLRRGGALRPGEFHALHDIGFTLARGEAMAVVGHNGAGKSTLLKILYGLLKPDGGRVRIAGRTAAIIELGTGFSPLLTGRENVEMGAALHGLGAAASRRLLDEVVAFAELGQFVDAPFQTYSSGMKARLSFALSALLRPDLLLVDEVLAVGDMPFQRKCIGFMRDFLSDGGALLFISHNAFQVQTVCRRGLLLDRGRQVMVGSAVDALDRLMEMRPAQPPGGGDGPAASGPLVIEAMAAEPVAGDRVRSGEAVRISLRYAASERVEAVWGFSLWTQDQWVCVAGEQGTRRVRIAPGRGTLTCVVDRLPLVGGRYLLRGAVQDPETRQPFAVKGYQDAPAVISVAEEEAGSTANIKMWLHQLVHLDVDWDGEAQTVS